MKNLISRTSYGVTQEEKDKLVDSLFKKTNEIILENDVSEQKNVDNHEAEKLLQKLTNI